MYEEHPCIDIELIEDILIQSHGYVSILCVLIFCSWMSVFCHTFALICGVCDFMVEFEVCDNKKLVSIVSLS